MRSGPSANDDQGWPSAQRPRRDEAASGPARYGSGPAGDPQARDAQFGPELSWPNGFRPLNERSRDGLESAYRAPDPADPLGLGVLPAAPRPPAGGGRGFAYQQPAFDDFGYGDPGYSDPSYNGPRDHPPTGPIPAIRPPLPPSSQGPDTPSPGFPSSPGFPGGTGSPGSRWYAGGSANRPEAGGPGFGSPDIYPVTGAQEALPDTGGYPDEWYGHPRLDDRVVDEPRPAAAWPRPDDRSAEPTRPSAVPPRAVDPRGADQLRPPAAAPRGVDPRLEGIRYDELRYDEPDGRDYDEPLDDDSWLRELRRSGPVFPNGPAGPSGEQLRQDTLAPGFPQRDRPGYGPGTGPAAPLNPGPGGLGGPAGPAAGPWRGPQPDNRMGPRMQTDAGRRPGGAFGPTGADTGFFGAPVGVLTPPTGTPVQDDAFLAGPSAAPFLTPTSGRPVVPGALVAPGVSEPSVVPGSSVVPGASGVRPGHGLDGPEITSSWPAQPSAEDLAFEEFWHEDDGEGNGEYSRLFGDEPEESAARSASKRRTGRRRGRSNDKRLWLALGGVVVVTAAAVAGILKFEFPSHSGPIHAMAIPNSIGSYERKVGLERQADLAALRNQVIRMSSGQASDVVSAVYESGDSTSGGSVQMIMFIGGHLANASPSASINGFTQQFPGAKIVSAGPMGGQAACVEEQAGSADSKAICVFFDDDSFGTLTSPTMNTTALANEMLAVRSAVESVVKE